MEVVCCIFVVYFFGVYTNANLTSQPRQTFNKFTAPRPEIFFDLQNFLRSLFPGSTKENLIQLTYRISAFRWFENIFKSFHKYLALNARDCRKIFRLKFYSIKII